LTLEEAIEIAQNQDPLCNQTSLIMFLI